MTFDYAVPSKKKLRVTDARNTKMAWYNVDVTVGLSVDEKIEARRNILLKAAEFGVDTKDWHKLKSISLEAMALNISNSDHPNKMPFSGILTRLDQPSDHPPGGSYGRKIIVTSEAAEKALSSLLGMAVDFTPSFDGHDAQTKIGIITSANVVGNAIEVEGFIYAADFPETAQLIKDLKEVLGFSFEAQRLTILDPTADVLTITDLAFTGAAILRKDKAAYSTTSLAAAAAIGDIDMTKEEMQALLAAALSPMVARLEKIEASATVVAAPAVVDVKAAVAEALAAQAEVQKLAAKQAEDMKAAVAAAVEAATKPLIDSLAAAETKAKDAIAAAKLVSEAPARKTLAPGASKLLAKAAVTLPEGDVKLSVADLDAKMKSASMTVDQRMVLKNELSRAGMLS